MISPKTKIAIVGGGFGLYGYLPALVKCGKSPVLPNRYRPRVAQRPALAACAKAIQWADDEVYLSLCEGAVIAVPPTVQPDWIDRCLALPNIRCLFLEKPLAATPSLAIEQQDKLMCSGKTFGIGYLFRYTPWGQSVIRAGAGLSSLHWSFRAHHFAHDKTTWKRESGMGGGSLRFYGIHVLALLAEQGYDKVASSTVTSDDTLWRATFTGPDLPPCAIEVNSNADAASFIVSGPAFPEIRLATPFDETAAASPEDARIPVLADYLSSFFAAPSAGQRGYDRTLRLWSQAEGK